MSKTIIIHPNGAEGVRLTRQATTESNWDEDSKVWREIKDIKVDNPIVKKSVNAKGEIKFQYIEPNGFTKKGVAKFKINKKVSEIITTLAKKIANNNALDYNINHEDEVEFWMVLDMLDWLVTIPKKGQKFFCRNASRQSVDEECQRKTVEYYTGKKVIKPNNGEFTLSNGDMLNKKDIKKEDTKFARSIDAIIPDINAVGFIKYGGPVGSVTSHLTYEEAKSFIKECKKYCNKHNDDKKFFIQVDCGAIEEHIPDMRESVIDYPNRIFIGNTEQVIEWVKYQD